jgi:hypothetical protein
MLPTSQGPSNTSGTIGLGRQTLSAARPTPAPQTNINVSHSFSLSFLFQPCSTSKKVGRYDFQGSRIFMLDLYMC